MNRSILGALLCALLCAACENGLAQQGYEPAQPIAFSHALHAGQFQVACQYCHFGAEQSRHAGVPPVSVCMNCHTQVKKDAPDIQTLTASFNAGKPIQWVKVHRLPDFVWFSHQNHVTAGVECQTCHGPVQEMVRVRQQNAMSMGWCLDCHRTTLAKNDPKLRPPQDCSACHR